MTLGDEIRGHLPFLRRYARALTGDAWAADDRHVEPHILIGFRYFYDCQLSAGKFAGPQNGRVGSFHCLDRNTRTGTDDDGLAQIEPNQFTCDMNAVIDVRLFDLVRGLGQKLCPMLR